MWVRTRSIEFIDGQTDSIIVITMAQTKSAANEPWQRGGRRGRPEQRQRGRVVERLSLPAP